MKDDINSYKQLKHLIGTYNNRINNLIGTYNNRINNLIGTYNNRINITIIQGSQNK